MIVTRNRPRPVDAHKQVAALTRQLARIERIGDLVDLLPEDLTFDLTTDDTDRPQRPAHELTEALDQVPATYRPDCLNHCEMAFYCRSRARAGTSLDVLGAAVREHLGGIDTATMALGLARGQLTPNNDQTEMAAALRHAARLRAELLPTTSLVPRGCAMSMVSALARLEAMETMAAVPLTRFRHRRLSDRPLVVVPLTMAGESGTPLAAMVGDAKSSPTLLVVGQPRNPDQRFAFAANFGRIVMDYIDSYRLDRREIASRSGETRSRYTNAPRSWSPTPAASKPWPTWAAYAGSAAPPAPTRCPPSYPNWGCGSGRAGRAGRPGPPVRPAHD